MFWVLEKNVEDKQLILEELKPSTLTKKYEMRIKSQKNETSEPGSMWNVSCTPPGTRIQL